MYIVTVVVGVINFPVYGRSLGKHEILGVLYILLPFSIYSSCIIHWVGIINYTRSLCRKLWRVGRNKFRNFTDGRGNNNIREKGDKFCEFSDEDKNEEGEAKNGNENWCSSDQPNSGHYGYHQHAVGGFSEQPNRRLHSQEKDSMCWEND